MDGQLSDQVVHDLLQTIADKCYISLHFDSPRLAGAYASELSGSGYGRILATFTEPSSRTIWNTLPVAFSGLPQTRITHVGGWNEQINGDLLWSCEVATVNVLKGGGYGLNSRDIAISLG